MSNLSPSTLALLRAAKNDAPSKESRHAIWGGVTSGLVTHTPLHITPQGGSIAASAAPAPVAAVATTAAASKGLATAAGLTGMKGAFIGALFGSAISIGVATFMLRTKPAPTPQNEIPRAPLTAQVSAPIGGQGSTQAAAQSNGAANAAANSNSANANANMAATPTTEIDSLPISVNAGSSQNSVGSATSTTAAGNTAHAATSLTASSSFDDTSAHATKKRSTATSAEQNLSPDDMLLREAALVQQARRDLQNGDGASALKAVRAARSLESRQLEPEEMKQEATALRLLGRDAEADKVESQRRTMYPNAL